ncbi:MAG: putative phosphodiesterase [Candidatus Latescibacterota bacterium]|jgi:predicted phosphodiesterase
MRIAILCDIHGNLPAFEAALDHAANLAPDLLIIAGDMVCGCPDSDLCWQRALDLNCLLLRGNQERYLYELACDQAPPLWQTQQFAPMQWTLDQLGVETCRSLLDLPMLQRPVNDLLVVHASLRNDRDTIRPYTSESELEQMFPSPAADLIIRGHNHYGQMRLWGQRQLVTCSSVGLPMDGHMTAQYLLLDRVQNGWRIEHQSVPYDVDAAIARFYETNYLDQCGPMAALFLRELVTATQQFVPFLHWYNRWKKVEELSLEQAVKCFLDGSYWRYNTAMNTHSS